MQYRNPADRGGSIRLLCLIVAALPFGGALAEGHQVVEEVVSIGTRGQGRTALDSPVPVDSLSDEQMRSTGQTEVGRMLQVLAPSFNFSSSSISDGTDALRPATLRGLGPDQTLVLVNGKRRHGSALIHVNTSVGRGTAGTDLNAIPASSIKRIEVLRDGAAAQYGSDAIAGVINLVLKDYAEGGEFSASYGQYTEGDGESKVFSYNQGLTLLDDGYLNFGVEYRDRGSTNRAGLTGVCQYDMCTDIGGGVFQTSDPRELIFDRQNFRIGDADSDQLSGTVNLSVPFDNGLEGYAFATYSQRDNTSGGFYRRANQPDRNPSELFDGTPINADGSAFYPDGFLPLINTDIEDQSYNAGLRGQLGEWEWDAGVGYAMNEFAFNISNSVNASLVSATGNSPTSADAGTLKLGLTTFDVDFTRPMDWGNLAFGAAYREDEYEINPGELVSYADFDTINGVSLGANDAAGGIQVFRGFSPDNVVDEDRSAWSLYVDAEYDQIDRWLLGAAVRHEDYDDFGSTTNGKLTASFELSETVRFRGAISTGFRAPSLQQQFFNSTSTQFVSDGMGGLVAEERGTFRNDSELAMGLGIPRLEEETSTNVSLGVVLQPTDNLNVTIDVYQIQIDDRIVISGSISRDDVMGIGNLEQAFIDAGANSAQFFLNAADTTTDGIDIVADWGRDMWGGDLGITFAANFTDTDIDSVKSPESLSTVPGIQDSVFTSQDRSILTDWQPESRMNLTGNFGRDSWRFKLAANRYGEYTVQEGSSDRQTFGSEILIDTQFAIDFDNGITFKIGGNNIFDATPDKNEIGQSRGGVIVDGNGDTVVDSPGVFTFSRRAAPFGFNGAYWYAGIDWKID